MQCCKWAGGIGTDWTPVRATGSRIHGTNGESQGVIPFIKIFNDTALAVNQGGKRKGAMCAYMEVWHLNFEQFLELEKILVTSVVVPMILILLAGYQIYLCND